MKIFFRIVGIVLVVMQVISLFGSCEHVANNSGNLMWILGFSLPGIIGVLLIYFTRDKK